MFLDAVEFIYNNFLIISVIIGSLAFSILFFRQWYEERKMNQMLSVKKTMLRSLREAAQKRPSLTRTLIIGVPLLFLAGFLYLSFRPPLDYSYHIKRLEGPETFNEVRASFYDKFYSSPMQSSTSMDDQEALKRINSEKEDVFDGIDDVLKTEDHLYVTTKNGIEVLNEEDGEVDRETTLLFPSSECDQDAFTPEGLFKIEGSLVLIAQRTEGACEGDSTSLLERKRDTVVRVYDVDEGHELKDTYEFSGLLSNANFDGEMLFMSVNDYIGTEVSTDDPEELLPSMRMNGSASDPELSEVRYIDNTNPNTFMTMYAVDIVEETFDYQMTLTDYRHHLDFVNDSAYMTTNSYTFESSSSVFKLPDPIQSVDTIVSKFSLTPNNVHYNRTKKLEGSISDDSTLSLNEEGLFMVTENQSRDAQWIYQLDGQLNEKASVKKDDHETFDNIFYHKGFLYLFSSEEDESTAKIYEIDDSKIELFGTHGGLGTIDHFERNDLFDLVLGFDKTEDEIIMTMYETTDEGILNPTRDKTIDYGEMDLELVEDYPFENIQYDRQQSHLIVPMFNGVKEPMFSNSERTIRGYTLFPNLWFGSESDLSFNYNDDYKDPYVYRFIRDDDHVYHITPGGLITSESEEPFEPLQRYNFYD
ncbi:MAG: beta-propeller domain-containing protein [Bacillota bacterium]